MTAASGNPLPAKIILTGSFHELKNPPDPAGPEQPDPPPELWPYLKIGVLQNFRTLFFQGEVRAGPFEQVISVSPGETLEVSMEVTRRTTIEEENESRTQFSIDAATEVSLQDEFTDKVSTVLQNSHSTSVSLGVSGSIGIVSGSVSGTDSYTTTKTTSNETMKRTLKQTSERVSQQLIKSYTVRAKRTEDVTTRDIHRRLMRNDSGSPMHFGFRKLLQSYRASIQYLGPQLVWHSLIPYPGEGLGRPRVVGEDYLPSVFVQSLMRELLVTDFRGLSFGWNRPNSEVVEYVVPLASEDRPLGARFLNGRDTIAFTAQGPGYEANMLCKITKFELKSPGQLSLRFAPMVVSATGALPNIMQLTLPDYQVVSINKHSIVTNPGDLTIETFLQKYRSFIMEAQSLEPRPSGDLRLEEREELLRRAIAPLRFTTSYEVPNIVAMKEFDSFFDGQAAFYQLFPPRFEAARRWTLFGTNSSKIPEYDTYRGVPPAKLGASLGWKIQADGDARRIEFLNCPLARVSIPIARGHEAEAIDFLKNRLKHQLSDNVRDMVAAMSDRRARETKASALLMSENSVDLRTVTPVIDESSAADADLAKALYPVRDIFETNDPLQGYLHEPITV